MPKHQPSSILPLDNLKANFWLYSLNRSFDCLYNVLHIIIADILFLSAIINCILYSLNYISL